ncbi:MAG: hypothetical protein ACU0CI_06415 [Shimia sp.]
MTDDPDFDIDIDAMGEPVISVFMVEGEDDQTQIATGIDPDRLPELDNTAAIMAQVLSVISMGLASRDDRDARDVLNELRSAMDQTFADDIDVLLPPQTLN